MKKYLNASFLVSTFMGLGKIPFMPGTIGSIIAYPVFFVYVAIIKKSLYGSDFITLFSLVSLFIIILFILGCYYSHQYCIKYKKEDPGEVIIDEVVGQSLLIALLLITLPNFSHEANIIAQKYNITLENLAYIVMFLAFILFRLFDIFKPWPIKYFDENIKGGLGIMLDDIVASILAYMFLIFLFMGIAI